MLHDWRACARARLVCWAIGITAGMSGSFCPTFAWAGHEKADQKLRLEEKFQTIAEGSSSAERRQKSLADLPLAKLMPAERSEAVAVLKNISLFRELRTLAFEVDPHVHEFFLDHPEIAVGIWRAMKISKFQLKEVEAGVYQATDGKGTKGRVKILYRDAHQILAICDGVVQSPIIPGVIQAKTLLHFQRDFIKSKEDAIWSRNRLRMFVAFPSDAVEAAAKVVAPLGNLIIDRNLREVCLFVAMMSAAMQRQPGWVEHMARQVEGVPEETRAELIRLTAEVYVAARRLEIEKQKEHGKATLEEVLEPIR